MSEAKISEAALDYFERAYYLAWRESTISFPQRTIRSHVRQANRAALEAALPHPHPQPAELAEQQGELVELAMVEKAMLAHAGKHLTRYVIAELRALAATGKQQVGEVHPDDVAVDAFADAMKAKMADARAKGRGGWEDPAQCSPEDLSRMLRDHVEKGDPRDVANFCMMLHQRGEAIAAQVGEVQGAQ